MTTALSSSTTPNGSAAARSPRALVSALESNGAHATGSASTRTARETSTRNPPHTIYKSVGDQVGSHRIDKEGLGFPKTNSALLDNEFELRALKSGIGKRQF